MVSPELIRRYAFFAGPDYEHIVKLSKVADEESVEAGHCFFHESDNLKSVYLVLERASEELLQTFEEDCRFGYIMTQKSAQVIRERLRDSRIESLADLAA